MLGSIIMIMLFGFITGSLARLAVPGPDPMPVWLTVAIGLVGSAAGGAIAIGIWGKQTQGIGIFAFIGAVLLVVAYRRFVQKRALWGPDAYRFPERGIGIEQYRERLQRAGIDPNAIGGPFSLPTQPPVPPVAAATARADDPTENPAHYLGLLEELHDSGVLSDEEYGVARTRLLERLRA